MKLVLLAALGFGGYLLFRKSASPAPPGAPSKTPSKVPTSASTNSGSSSSPSTIPTFKVPKIPVAADNNSPTLSSDETASLATDSNDLLFGWAMVTNHKAFAQAIANKLAVAGDTRAAAVTARIANWSTFKLPVMETDIASSPLNYTYQQIYEAALASESIEFKRWAAAFLEAEHQADSAAVLRAQIDTF